MDGIFYDGQQGIVIHGEWVVGGGKCCFYLLLLLLL